MALGQFNAFAKSDLNFYPSHLRNALKKTIDAIYLRLVDYANLWNYFRDLYQQPGVEQVCSVDHVKQLYYAGLPEINPTRIVPKGPKIDFDLPHKGDRLFPKQLHLDAQSTKC